MKAQRNALRAGIFMVVSLVLVIFVILAISGAAAFTQSFKTYPVAFALKEDIGGLRTGDDVRLGGLKVGKVKDIRIEPVRLEPSGAEAPAVVVYIEVPSRYPLNSDAAVTMQRTLTGGATINIDDFGVGAPLQPGDHMRGRPDAVTTLIASLATMQPDLHQTVANLKVASGKLNTDLDKFADTADSFTTTGLAASSTVQDLHIRIPDIVAHYHEVAAAAARMLDTVHDLLGGQATGDFHGTLANFRQITADFKTRTPDILQKVQTTLSKLDVTVGRAEAAMQDIQSTAANAKDLTAGARSVIVDNKSKLDGIISSLKATSDNLKYASVEIRHSPWRLLYQPSQSEVANLNIYDSVRQFAEGADSLDDAADALKDAVKDQKMSDEDVKKLMARLDDSFAKFQAVQEKLWDQIKP